MIQTLWVGNKHWNSFPKLIPTHSALRGLIFLLQLSYCAGILWSGCRLDVCVRVWTCAHESAIASAEKCGNVNVWKCLCVGTRARGFLCVTGGTCMPTNLCSCGSMYVWERVHVCNFVLVWERGRESMVKLFEPV